MTQELLYDRETGKEHSAVHGIILFKNTSEFHKKEEEEKERLQKAVQEADAESKAKTDFMNRISHDIRTPINGIMGMLEILRKNAHNPEKMEECMDKIQVSADHLLALVNDVLDMNKLETDQIREENEPFDLEVLMREVAVLMNPLLEQNQIHTIDLIINRIRMDMVKRGDMMSVDDVTEILAVPLIGILPDDEQVVIGTNQGEPVIGLDSKAGKGYLNICKRITGTEVSFMNLDTGKGLFSRISHAFRKN